MFISNMPRGRARGPAFRRGLVSKRVCAVWMAALVGSPAFAQSTWDTELADAFKNGDFSVRFRYRYEFVDTPRTPRDANASTLLTRLEYKSAEFKNVFLTLNMDDLRPIIASNFDDTRNGKSQYAVVPDPKGTDLNLASLTWTGLEGGSVVLGRQRIKRTNLRFIGNVAWRQNEQTYDSLSFGYRPNDKIDLFYAYVDRVKRVVGPDEVPSPSGAASASWQSNSHLIDGAYTFSPALKLFGYIYLLDFKNAIGFSNSTIGIRATGTYPFDNGPRLGYQAEFATQGDYGDNPNNYDANYILLEGALSWEKFGFRLMYEVLEGDGPAGTSFLTPLATLHIFNGWADRFLVTPGAGLEDFAVEGNVQFLSGNWRLIYHTFSANTGGTDYGDELDFVASWRFGERYTALVKFALYSSDAASCSAPTLWTCDADKAWMQFTADF